MEQGLSKGFGNLKEKTSDCVDSDLPDWNKEFYVHVDTLSIALGTVLSQPGEGDIAHPISFLSEKLSIVENKYTTVKREGLEMVYGLQNFRHYLLGSHIITGEKTSVWGENMQMDTIVLGIQF
jgi:hypothetical protein